MFLMPVEFADGENCAEQAAENKHLEKPIHCKTLRLSPPLSQ